MQNTFIRAIIMKENYEISYRKKEDKMYKALNVELAKNGLTKKDLARISGISYSSLLDKLNRRTSFTFDECVKIKRALNTSLPLEDLFFCS